jgi:DNA-binding NarL/FixJ family response regulator
MIRVALLDDHPAVRAGLEAILAREPGLQVVGSAADEKQLWPLIRRGRPDVIVLDVHHPGRDGLMLSLQIKRLLPAPAVVPYSASTPDELVVAGVVAGADAVVGKASSTAALVDAVREVARAPRTPPRITGRMRTDAATRLDPADHSILAMRLAGHTLADIGAVLGLAGAEMADRVAAIVAALSSVRTLAPAGSPA